MNDEEKPTEYASPPCYMHEVDPSYFGLTLSRESAADAHVKGWRKAERERLIAQRIALDTPIRADHARRIGAHLDALIGDPAGLIISAYWPFRGEPDLRPWLEELHRKGARTALPVVIAKKAPLVFRLWHRGDRLTRGVWNIPIPAAGIAVRPHVVIAPVVGFDAGCYRLGYGGGFFDRTLAELPTSTVVIGVGYTQAAIATIYPQPFDIPMHHVVTEHGVKTR